MVNKQINEFDLQDPVVVTDSFVIQTVGGVTKRATGKELRDLVESPNIKIEADQFDNPVNADFAVNALAPAVADSNNAALVVRAFDDATEEGVAFGFTLPAQVTNIILKLIHRANTSPPGAAAVLAVLYAREIPDNAVVSAWSAGTGLGPISLPMNEFFQYTTFTIPLATLGITADRFAQFELTRDGTSGSDTLVGDWNVLEAEISFS